MFHTIISGRRFTVNYKIAADIEGSCYGLARPRCQGPPPTAQEERDLVFFFLAYLIQTVPPPFIDGGRLKT
jgi:hypothetical protein